MKNSYFITVLFLLLSCQLSAAATTQTFEGELTDYSDFWLFRYDKYYYETRDFTVPDSGEYVLEVTNADFDAMLLLMKGEEGSGSEIKLAEDDDSAGSVLPRIQMELAGQTPYFFHIETYFPNVQGEWALELTPVVAPVPGAAWLFGAGLVGLAGVRRKKKA